MRGAIFGALGDIKRLHVLDAFAGSGALAIEAISRGAKTAQAIEVDKQAHDIIQKNAASLGISSELKVTRAHFSAWSTRHQNIQFDIVFADPPYDKLPYRDLNRLARHVGEDGVLVLSWPGSAPLTSFEGLEVVQHKDYGDGQLVFYKHIR